MIDAIESGRNSNLFALRYDATWQVQSLLLIPSFFFTASAIEKRNPLAPTARRARWIGCNILLGHIPASGRIPVVSDGIATPAGKVREAFKSLRELNQIRPGARG